MTAYKCPVCKHEKKLKVDETVSIGVKSSLIGNGPQNVNRIFICVNDECSFGEANENFLKEQTEHYAIA